MENEEWKLEFDLNEQQIQDAIDQARANTTAQNVEEEVEDEELLATLGLDQNYEKSSLEFREQIRRLTGTPNPAQGFELDRATLDTERDHQFELAQRLKRE